MSLVVMWCIFAALCLYVVGTVGWSGASLFFSDIYAGTWRAIYNVDFIIHILLVAGWVAWKEEFSFLGVLTAFFCICGGALFTLWYLFYLSVVNKGDFAKILVGKRSGCDSDKSESLLAR